LGGNTKNAYTFSLGYDKNSNETRNQFQKLNVKVANTFQPIKDLTIDIGIYYTNSVARSGAPTYGTIKPGERSANYYRLADDNGNPLSVSTLYRDIYVDTAGGRKLKNWKYYPLEDYKHDKTTTKLQEIISNIGLKYRIKKILNFDLSYQYQKQFTQSVRLADTESFYTRNLINLYSQVNRNTGTVKYIVPVGSIRSLNNPTNESQNLGGQFNLDIQRNNHVISSILGAEIRQANAYSDGYTAYGYNPDPLTNAGVDLANTYPLLIGGSRGIPGAPISSNTVFRFISLYGTAAYSFKRKYLFSISGRRDGSNIFGSNTNDKWNPLWSVGAGWVISEEPAVHISKVNYLKLRTSYGVSGNVDLSKTALPIARFIGPDQFSNYPFAGILTLNNPDLRWEKSQQINVALDFSLKNEVLFGTIEYYLKKGKDLYGETSFDYTSSGISDVVVKNVAAMKGRGLEINLQSNIFKTKFKWNANLLFNYNKSTTTAYYSTSAQQPHILLGGGTNIIPVVGKDLYGIAAYKWGGLDNLGNPQGFVNGQKSIDYNAISAEASTKQLNDGNIVYVGSALPLFYGSFIHTFSYKQFSASVNISYKFKYYFSRPSINYDALISVGSGHKDYEKRWKKSGDENVTNVPSMVYPNNSMRDQFYSYSEINIEKGDHIRLQYINFGYSLNKSVIKKLPLKEIQLFTNMSNLGVLWRANDKKLDPDYPSSLTPTNTWAFGLRGKF
jgi:hypothetical protein